MFIFVKPYLILKETLNAHKNTISKKSRVAHPCQKYIYLKKAIKNKHILTKKVGPSTLVKKNKTCKIICYPEH